jgi:hypothetical protein
MNLRLIYSFVVTLALLIALCSYSSLSRESRLMEEGQVIIGKIESFRKDKGKLPDSLMDVGIEEKEEGPIYYEKRGEAKYVLWFGTELGESVTYDSESRKWEPINK